MARLTSIQDIKTRKFWTAALSELLGTMFLVLVACGSCARFDHINKSPKSCDDRTDIVQISLAFGLSVATIVWIIARVSGGHINPAVTFGFLVTRKITVLRAIFYIIAQCAGALIGAWLLKAVSPHEAHPSLGHSGPGSDLMTLGQIFAIEMLITFVLVWTVFATCDSRRTDLGGSGPLAIGFAIAMCHLWAVPYTGSGMNPARVFGVAIIANKMDASIHWAYWVGPLLGAALAALLYDFVQAVNATGVKLKGFFRMDYSDEYYDNQGLASNQIAAPGESGLPLKGRQ